MKDIKKSVYTPAAKTGPKPNINKTAAGSGDMNGTAEGSLTIKRSKKLDIIARIGCVLVAAVIWIYVMANDSPTAERTFESVPIQTTGESDYSLLSGSSDVSVTIKGRRSVINKLDENAVQAFADISGVTSPGWQKVTVDVSAPTGTTLQSVSPTSVLLYFGNRTTVTVPVKINPTEYTLPENYELGLGDAVIKPAEITVTGPEDVLARIDCAQATIALGSVSGSVTSKAPLKLIDANGEEITSSFVKMQVSEATVAIPVYRLARLPLTLSYKYGYYNSGNTQITVSPETVLVRGESALVETAKWSYTIDEKLITGDGQYTIPVTLPDGVTNASGTTEATLTVKHIGTTTKQVMLTDIAVINPDKLNYTLADATLVVTLRGPAAYLNYTTAKNVTATIDLSSFKNASGSVLVPIVISVPSSMAGIVYELGAYTMTVKLG